MSDYNPFSLAGKTVLVTGASSGIGRATAIECSRLGAKLVVTGRNSSRLAETLTALEGDGHQAVEAELTNADDLAKLVDACPEVNGLVLCAGKGMMLPLMFSTRDKFDTIFNVNLFAPAELLRLLLKKKKLAKGASVAVVSSIGGTPGGKFVVGNDVYGISKAAVWSLMKYAARELAPKKIRVNSVNPGMVDTPLAQCDSLSDEQYRADVEKYPLKRYGTPNDIAHGIIYLLSDASSWMTGQSLVLDGGLTI